MLRNRIKIAIDYCACMYVYMCIYGRVVVLERSLSDHDIRVRITASPRFVKKLTYACRGRRSGKSYHALRIVVDGMINPLIVCSHHITSHLDRGCERTGVVQTPDCDRLCALSQKLTSDHHKYSINHR